MPSHSHSALPTISSPPHACLAGVSAIVVDDEAHVRVYLRHVLATLGVRNVWEAANGREAVKLYRTHRPTFVLLDINMPLLSGGDALAQIMEVDRNAVVIVVTSQSDRPTVQKFLERGALGYLLKHLPRNEMQEMLAEILEDVGVVGSTR